MSRKLILVATLCIAACACGRSGSGPAENGGNGGAQLTEAEQLDALAESYFEDLLPFYPDWAMTMGDNRYNDQYPVDIGPEWLHRALNVTSWTKAGVSVSTCWSMISTKA
jgi:hypothetical protein